MGSEENIKPHIVVLYSHNPSRLAHLRKLYSLREKYEITLILDEKHNHGWQTKFVDHIIAISMKEIYEDFSAIVNNILAVRAPNAIINLSEACVPLHALLCRHWELIGPDEIIVNIARNKYLMRDFCKTLGIPVPRFSLLVGEVHEACKELTFPVVVKPIIGGGSTLVQRFDSFDELEKNLRDLKEIARNVYLNDSLYAQILSEYNEFPFVIEEVVEGDVLFDTCFPYSIGEISVESVYSNGEISVIAIHDKPIPNNGPYFEEYIWSTPTRIPRELVMLAEDYVSRIHKKLGEGCYVLHTEFRTFSDGLVLLEFGARLGGGPIYRSVLHSTGNDYIELLINLSMREEISLNTRNPKPTITHCIWAEEEGEIEAIVGEPIAITDPFYCEHQIYDDVGEIALRAPKSSRSNGHIVVMDASHNFVSIDSNNQFIPLEKSIMKALKVFRFLIKNKK